MLNLIFVILMFIVFGKLLVFSIRATWGISRMFFSLILLPLFLIGLVVKGLLVVAAPILVIVGIVSLLCLND